MEKYLIKGRTFEKIKKEIKENEKKETILEQFEEKISRKVIEKLPVKTLLISQKSRKDKLYQRDSGFNEVLARMTKNKNITIGINLDEIIESKGKEKSKILARVQQNIFLSKKANLKMKFIAQNKKNERNPYDLKSLGLVLGMKTDMLKD